jgi:endonuclease YncB( thermonuclease family)
MRLTVLVFFAMLVALSSYPALAELTGRPRIIDGDTIQISLQRIRLFGIDAPEGKQLSGRRKGYLAQDIYSWIASRKAA